MNKLFLCAVAAASIAAGCASPQSNDDPAAERGEREYTTGSNIPKKSRGAADGVQVHDRDSIERSGGMPGMPQMPRAGS
jgi:hypothetical protein